MISMLEIASVTVTSFFAVSLESRLLDFSGVFLNPGQRIRYNVVFPADMLDIGRYLSD